LEAEDIPPDVFGYETGVTAELVDYEAGYGGRSILGTLGYIRGCWQWRLRG
jgi:hypothetical protein